MKTAERLLKAAEDIWAGYHTHPFVEGLKDGTLDVKKFRRYIIQDYWYLMEYTKVFAVGVAKSRSVETMKLFAKYIQAILDGEVDVHNGYMGMLGITREELEGTPIAQDNRSYTAYMLSVAYKGGEAEVLTAILSCAYSYEVIAHRIVAERPDAPRSPAVRQMGAGLHHSALHRQQHRADGDAGAADGGLHRKPAAGTGGDLHGLFPVRGLLLGHGVGGTDLKRPAGPDKKHGRLSASMFLSAALTDRASQSSAFSAAWAARYRKVAIWPRVQVLLGEKVVSVVPRVTPLATAQFTAGINWA